MISVELKDLQAILNSLPDEVQIEYKLKVEEALKEKARTEKRNKDRHDSRKVHIKSASDKPSTKPPTENHPKKAASGSARVTRKVSSKEPEADVKKRPLKINERPAWGTKTTKKVVKMSEKDPFYHQKKEEREIRKAKRERQLQYLQELNSQRIPSLSKSPGRGPRDPSPEAKQPAGHERGRKPANEKKEHITQPVKERESSPNILSLINNQDESGRSAKITGKTSPPIPSVRHRLQDTDRDAYHYANNYLRNSHADSRYGDIAISGGMVDGDFLPFMRTTEILDPSKAEEPLAISRENSRMQRARQAYIDTHNPAKKGKQLDIYQDREREAAMKVGH